MKHFINFNRRIFNRRYFSTISKPINNIYEPLNKNFKFDFNYKIKFNDHKFRVLGGLFGAIGLTKYDKNDDYLKIFLGGCVGYVIPGTTIILSGTTIFNQHKQYFIK